MNILMMENVTTVAPAPIMASVPSEQTVRWNIHLSKDLWFCVWTAFLPFQIFFSYNHPILRWQDCGPRITANITPDMQNHTAFECSPLTDSNIQQASQYWVFDQTFAAETCGDINQWDVAKVTSMSSSKSISILEKVSGLCVRCLDYVLGV